MKKTQTNYFNKGHNLNKNIHINFHKEKMKKLRFLYLEKKELLITNELTSNHICCFASVNDFSCSHVYDIGT